MSNPDPGLEAVSGYLRAIPNLESVIGEALRQAIDDVIEGPRTGRWRLEDLSKVEKSYIGTRVEILVRTALKAGQGRKLDYLIAGHEVDAKYTISMWDWMIPQEAMGELCLLLSANDADSSFVAGLVRIEERILTEGKNQDKKRHIASNRRDAIRWLVRQGKLPRNFLMQDINAEDRRMIFSMPAGQDRVNLMFRRFPRKPIPAAAIIAAATEFQNARPRVLEAAKALPEFRILDGENPGDREAAKALGISLAAGHFVSVQADGAGKR
jgi:hypothetical protein